MNLFWRSAISICILIAIASAVVVVSARLTRVACTAITDGLMTTDWVPSPGRADYRMSIIANFSLYRRFRNARSIIQRNSSDLRVDEDVTRLGWNDWFIVAYSTASEFADRPASAPAGGGWWIINAKERRRYGPFTDEGKDRMLRELGAPHIETFPTPEAAGDKPYFGDDPAHQRELIPAV